MARFSADVTASLVSHAGRCTEATCGQLYFDQLALEVRVFQPTDGLHGILHSLHVNKGIVLYYVTLNHRSILLKLGPELLIGAATAYVAHMQFGGAPGLPFAHLHIYGLPVELVMVEFADGLFGLLLTFHVHKAIIFQDVTLFYFTVFRKKRAQIIRGRA